MRAAAVKLTPLTEQEALFAEEHHDVIWKFLTHYRLEYGEYYGIAALGYLQAVKKWHVREDLHQYAFETIAWNNMRCHVGNERKKQERRIRTVSLDDMIPWTEGLTWGSTITYDNMDYIHKKEVKRSVEIKYGVKIPETAKMGRLPCVEIEALVEFLASSHKTMLLSYDTAQQATNKASNLRGWIKKNGKTDVAVYKSGANIYVEKRINKKGEKQT